MQNTPSAPCLEDIALRYSGRGMDTLRPALPAHFFRRAAAGLLRLGGGTVLLTTGFYVCGVCETDGPPGALCLAETLRRLGFSPVLLTDALCRGLFDGLPLPVIYAPLDAGDDYWECLLTEWQPSALISIERCGKNRQGDYANMRRRSIAPYTAPIDRLFELAAGRGLYTVGIGDGGNEIGMGNVADLLRQCTDLDPCVVRTSDLLVATVSNWGGYALSAALAAAADPAALPPYRQVADYIALLAQKGCVDGVAGIVRNWVDGFPPEIEEEIYTDLTNAMHALAAASGTEAEVSL